MSRIWFVVCGAALLAGSAWAQAPQKPIKLFVDGSEVATEWTEGGARVSAPPRLVDSRLYLPVRLTYEALGARLDWKDDKKTLVITVPGHSVEFPTGASTMVVDGEEVEMGEAARVLDRSMYLSESVFQRTLPVEVRFDREEGQVEVTFGWEKRKVAVADLTGWPRFFRGKEFTVEGEYRGWLAKGLEGPVREGPTPPPPKADGRRGDWILRDGAVGLYVSKRRVKGLDPIDDVGVRVRVTGIGAFWEKTVPPAKPGEQPTILAIPYIRAESVETL